MRTSETRTFFNGDKVDGEAGRGENLKRRNDIELIASGEYQNLDLLHGIPFGLEMLAMVCFSPIEHTGRDG